jgi:hypothetical protein
MMVIAVGGRFEVWLELTRMASFSTRYEAERYVAAERKRRKQATA